MREFSMVSLLALIATPVLLASIHVVGAQVMESSSYRIQSDSLNFGGGRSTSSNYTQESTFGEVATGDATSASYNLYAGYQQMQEVFIALAGGDNVVMSPSIPGISGGTANGSTTVTVTTDSAAGYELHVQASGNPAMQSDTDTIADYVPGGNPDFSFDTGSDDAHFGYSPEGVDIVQRFLDDTNDCATGGTDSPLACWDGLSTSDVTIASASGPNQPSGATTSIHFRVGIGGSVGQPPGVYVATTTITAIPL